MTSNSRNKNNSKNKNNEQLMITLLKINAQFNNSHAWNIDKYNAQKMNIVHIILPSLEAPNGFSLNPWAFGAHIIYINELILTLVKVSSRPSLF